MYYTQSFKLEDLAYIIDCEHKTAPTIENSEFYSIRTANISNGKIDFNGSNRISYETYIEWTKRATPKDGDIILAREAPVGEVGIISKGYKSCLGQRTVLISVKNNNIYNKYLLYYMVNPIVKFDLISRSTGSVVSHVNVKDIRNFEIIVPPLPEQKTIASILSSLDDKIDLLHRQNKTLESMAEALFKKMFEQDFKDLDDGQDWREGKLGDVSNFSSGKSRPNNTEGGFFPIYGGNGILGFTNQFNSSGTSIIIGRVGAYCGSLYLEYRAIWITDNALSVKSINENYTSYLFYLLKSLKLNEMAEGSSHPLLTQTLLNSIEIIIPPDQLILIFSCQVNNWLIKIDFNNKQIRTLEKMRDNLLPKLMSGEIRVEQDLKD